jgi:bifunctional enzyme CysN/CysC
MSRSVIRLLTCGSVDDGKSTLIGRLLVETDSVPHDTISAARFTRRSGSTITSGEVDYSLLTDGLEAEREQGITIDVAYRSMSLRDGKRLIISDAPGHEQYTRNMVVAASRADIGLILVDATKGVRTQTLRHSTICAIMGVKRIIVAINKLDALGYSQEFYTQIQSELSPLFTNLGIKDLCFIPMSALNGDNVTSASEAMSWYSGETLLDAIQGWNPAATVGSNSRMDIQMISRAEDFRGVCGTVHGAGFVVGDEVIVLPSKQKVKIAKIISFNEENAIAGDLDSVTLVLEPDVDATRGDVIVNSANELEISNRYQAKIVWLNENPLIQSRSYLLISGPTQVPVTISKIKYVLDVVTREEKPAQNLQINEIGLVEIATDRAIALEPYSKSRQYGNFVIVDRLTQQTVGAGMVEHSLRRGTNITSQAYEVLRSDRALQKSQKAQIIWLTGLSGSGKSTIANELAKQLFAQGFHAYVLDGDNLRSGLNMDLSFTPEDRAENVRRVSEVAKLMVDAGLIVIIALVSPFETDRLRARSLVEEGEFLEIFVDTPIEICRARDPKGLYKKADSGKIPNFTGVGQEYEVPSKPELIIDGTKPILDSVKLITDLIQ